MAEWLTPGATAIAGYLGGLFTKPIQNWWEERRQARRLRKALYVEIAGLMSHCQHYIDELHRDRATVTFWQVYMDTLCPCRCFETAKQTPVALNLLPDIIGINHFFGGLEALSSAYKEATGQNQLNVACVYLFLQTVGNMLILVNKAELSKSRLTRVGDERTKRFLQGVPDLDRLTRHFKRIVHGEEQGL